MDTATKTFVGAANYDECFLVLVLEGFGFSFLEDGVGRLTVCSGLRHCLLSSGEFGGGNNFHSFRDFLNIFDRFQALLDFSESCIVGSVGAHGPGTSQCC